MLPTLPHMLLFYKVKEGTVRLNPSPVTSCTQLLTVTAETAAAPFEVPRDQGGNFRRSAVLESQLAGLTTFERLYYRRRVR
jgi:hypothetical protein